MIEEVNDALAAWNKAPAHIRAMAGQYVGPILIAISAQAACIERIAARVGILEEIADGQS